MKPRTFLAGSAVALALLLLLGFGGWLFSLPPASVVSAPQVPESEMAAMLAGLQPPKRARPLVAVVGINDATETNDYLMPAGILRRAGVADVLLLATSAGPVKLYPALTVLPDATLAEFDQQHPKGADYVIVPAMSRDDDPTVVAWLQRQAAGGATIIAVCAGAKVAAAAGLLDGRRATTHWYYVKELLRRHPSIDYVPDRRMVVDRGVATTTGITAAMPMTLTLIQAIAGRAKAEDVAHQLGLTSWDARHDSSAFRFTRPFATTVLENRLALWNHEKMGIELRPGMDEVALGLVADAWSRTYRSGAVTFAGAAQPVTTSQGVRIVPDRVAASWTLDDRVESFAERTPAHALRHALQAIAVRYGQRTGDVVRMQLEYPASPVRL